VLEKLFVNGVPVYENVIYAADKLAVLDGSVNNCITGVIMQKPGMLPRNTPVIENDIVFF
jgi:hypothetical protein